MSNFQKNLPHIKSCILITLLIIIIYSFSLQYPFVLDDRVLIMDNYLIRDWKFLPRIFLADLSPSLQGEADFYRPVQNLTYLFDFQIWQYNPYGYHLTNILLFIINSLLVYWLAFIISKDINLSAVTTFLFSSHPIYSESVAYISGRADVLVGIFTILSLILFISAGRSKGTKGFLQYFLSLAAFILALLSKEMAIVLPLVLILYDFSFRKEGRFKFDKFIKRYFLFFAIVLIYVLLRFSWLRFADKLSSMADLSLLKRLLIILANFNFYFGLFLAPFGLHMFYFPLIPKNFWDLFVICGCISWLVIISGMIYFYKRNPQLFFWTGWFLIWFIPQSGIYPINAFFAEHFMYLSIIGFFVIVVIAIKSFFSREISIFLFRLFLIVFCSGTILHNFGWANEVTLYEKILKFNPYNHVARLNLAGIYFGHKFYKEAEAECRIALEAYPTLTIYRSNLVAIYLAMNQPDRAIGEMEKSLDLSKIVPAIPKNRFPTKKEYLKILQKDKLPVSIYNEIGILYAKRGLLEPARRALRLAIKILPAYADSHWNLGLVYWQMGKSKEARQEWELTLALKPDHPYAKERLAKLKQIEK